MESQLQLLDMPEDSMMHILERCDFVSLQLLRKTCHTLRNFIDEKKPFKLVKDINIHGKSDRVTMIFFETNNYDFYPSIHLEFRNSGDGNAKIIWYRRIESSEKIIENSSNLDAFSQVFKSVLGCKHSKWGKITLWCNKDVLKKVQESFSSQTSPLRVHTLSISSTECQNIVTDILRCLCPNTLTDLDLAAASEHWDMSEMVKLEQWKKTKELDMRKVVVSADIECYSHFETAKICFENVTVEDLCKLKKIFLNTPSITKRFELHGVHIPSEEMVITTLGEPYLSGEPVSKPWYFKRSDNYVLCMNSSINDFVFSIITKTNVPRDAVIV